VSRRHCEVRLTATRVSAEVADANVEGLGNEDAAARGPLGLSDTGSGLQFMNLYVREL
jgi:hypothetical protein